MYRGSGAEDIEYQTLRRQGMMRWNVEGGDTKETGGQGIVASRRTLRIPGL